LATKSDLRRAISVSRRTSRQHSTSPAARTISKIAKAVVNIITWRRTTSRGAVPGGAYTATRQSGSASPRPTASTRSARSSEARLYTGWSAASSTARIVGDSSPASEAASTSRRTAVRSRE
jgi:hypothetical protein